ncbi:MAG: hypothetical protein KKA34_03415 [Candidatus Omnitrophica bacterium]|nr:hypothetical protein [Candidatus Omnitrophota bacterium]
MDCVNIKLSGRKKKNVLALGAQSKGGFCFLNKDRACFSGPFGDMGDMENFADFQRRINRIRNRIRIKPDIIACDLHPDYTTSRYASEMVKDGEYRLSQIQHHEAHIASCVADNEVKGRVIGIAFDGTGLGSDGNIWGGEFFIGTTKKFRRAAHLKYIRMPGGEAAISEPWRMAFSYLYNIYGKETGGLDLGFLDRMETGLLSQIIQKGINSPFTSSIGRLFDAVAAIIGIRGKVEYEGQAAIELEKKLKAVSYRLKAEDGYNFKYNVKDEVVVIDWAPVIKAVVRDLKNKKTKAEISAKFHNAVCYMVRDVCVLLRRKCRIRKVCLSGGVFQNRFLTACVRPLLEKENFKVYYHRRLPTHDGNIALGQAVIAAVQG